MGSGDLTTDARYPLTHASMISRRKRWRPIYSDVP